MVVPFCDVPLSPLAVDGSTANTADDLLFQQKRHFSAGRTKFVLGQHRLHTVEKLGRNDLRINIRKYLVSVSVYADVLFKAEDLVYGVSLKRFAHVGDPSCGQLLDDLAHDLSLVTMASRRAFLPPTHDIILFIRILSKTELQKEKAVLLFFCKTTLLIICYLRLI